MKTKLQYFKENWIFCIIMNIFLIPVIWMPINTIELDMYYKVGTTILIWVYLYLDSMKSWYNDYRFDYLNDLIKKQNRK